MYDEQQYKMMDEIEAAAIKLKESYAKLLKSVDDYIAELKAGQ